MVPGPVWPERRCIGVVVWAQYRPERLRGGVVEVFGLFSNTILTSFGQTALDTPLARSLVSYEEVSGDVLQEARG